MNIKQKNIKISSIKKNMMMKKIKKLMKNIIENRSIIMRLKNHPMVKIKIMQAAVNNRDMLQEKKRKNDFLKFMS